jgi:ribosomal protein L37E
MTMRGGGEGAGFVDKAIELQCRECGEIMVVERDYGVTGQALRCASCGFYVEEIELRDTITERSR